MSISICTSCLARLRLTFTSARPFAPLSIGGTALFSTSSPKGYERLKKQQGHQIVRKYRERTATKIKKKGGRPKNKAQPGERKAERKRVVLSNTNALEVATMQDLTVQNMADSGQIGKMLGLDNNLLDQLREAKAFKPTQNWKMFRRPGTLMRRETVMLGERFHEVNESQGTEGLGATSYREIITGERHTGKSVLLLQAMSMAFLHGWVVINVPEAQDLTIGQSSYVPVPSQDGSRDEQTYHQPHLTSALLSRMAYANEKVLSSLKVSRQYPNVTTKPNMNLQDLALLGIKEPAVAWSVWQAVWAELMEPNDPSKAERRPPILIAVDGIDHWMSLSKYRSAEYNLIHAHQFTLIRQILSLLFPGPSPTNDLVNGGMVLAATTSSHSPNTPSFNLLLRQLIARGSGVQPTDQGFPMPEPYSKVDQSVLDLLYSGGETKAQVLKGLSRDETRGLLEYFARSGILKENISQTLVGEHWSLSGGGVIGELAKFGTRIRAWEGTKPLPNTRRRMI